MNARLTICRAQPGKIDEVVKIFRDSITPFTKQQKGFQQVFLFTKPNSDQVVWLTFWATEADLVAAQGIGFFKEQIGKVSDLLTGPPMTDMYQVATDEKSPRFKFWLPRPPKASAS